jgi:hypothetical protein
MNDEGTAVSPRCFTRFLELVRENSEHKRFTFNGVECFYREWVFDRGRYRVLLENQYGRRVEIDAEKLAGNYFGVERL